MKTFAGFIVGIMLAGSVCGLGRRHPQPALPGGFPAKGTFVLTDADGRGRFDLEFGKDSLRVFRYRISDAADRRGRRASVSSGRPGDGRAEGRPPENVALYALFAVGGGKVRSRRNGARNEWITDL